MKAMENEVGFVRSRRTEVPSYAPKGKGKVDHCYSHESGGALDVQTRCDESGHNYMALHLSDDPTDVDHQRYKQFEADLVRGHKAG